jgi:peroxiredoxin
LVEQALFIDAEVEPKFKRVVSEKEGATAAFETEIAKVLQNPAAGALTLEKGARYITILQQTGNYDLARKLCQMYQQSYASSEDQQLRQKAEQVTGMALKRMDLIGQPLDVQGRRTDGGSIDFTQYAGNPVLVAFFGAFDPRCQQEIMNIKTAYDKYQSQGLQVIGVSVDPDPQKLSQFLQRAQLPWETVVNSELAERCGADMLPFCVLVGKDGIVQDIFVQGSELTGKLEKLLGPAESGVPGIPSSPPGSSFPSLPQSKG